MPLPVFTDGEVLYGSDVDTYLMPIAAVKTADQSVGNTTLVNDSALAISIDANAYYMAHMYVEYEGGAAGSSDLKWAWTLPGNATFHYNVTYHFPNSTRDVTYLELFASTQGAAATNGTSRESLRISGVIFGSSAGTVQFRWAQNSSNATPTIVHQGSYLVARRIA